MGTSNWHNVPFCVEGLMRIEPKTVLDVGTGFGRWGMVVREFCELWRGRIKPSEWEVWIEGVEAFGANIADYHRSFYNKIHVGDVRDLIADLPGNWSAILFGDVIEHFAKEEGLALLQWAVNASDYVMVNVPLGGEWPQGAAYGNTYERHLSVWASRDFDNLPVCRCAFFRDYIDRPFGSFFLSRLDPNHLKQQLISASTRRDSENEQMGSVMTSGYRPEELSLSDLYAMAQELDGIKHSKSYRLAGLIRRWSQCLPRPSSWDRVQRWVKGISSRWMRKSMRQANG